MKRLAPLCRFLLITACLFVAYGAVIAGLRYKPLAWLVLAFLAWRRWRGWSGSGWSHGTARWSRWLDLYRGGLLGDSGLILGRVEADTPTRLEALRLLMSPRVRSDMACRLFLASMLGGRWASGRMLRLAKHVHLATFAPTGRGKGTSVILPNLLAQPGSVVVTDPKGENFKLTAEHRVRAFGHKALRLDPFGLCGKGSATFNPLACVDPTADDFLDQCRDIANMLVVRAGTEHDPHWNDAAELVLTGFTAYVCACETEPSRRNLGLVRAIVSSPDRFKSAMAVMQKEENLVVRRLGDLLEWFKDKELSSVLTTVQRHTQFLDSPAVSANTATSSFDPRELRGQKRSLYLILPADRIGSTMAPLMRLWIGMIIRTLSREGADETRPVLFLLDEAAHLGKIQALEDAVTLMRGMGIRLWFFFQSLGQLKACYGEKAEIFLDNCDTQQYFGTNSYESAEAISRKIGEFTLGNVSYTRNSGWSREEATAGKPQSGGSHSGGSSTTSSDMARRLIKPEEILCLEDGSALVTHRNMPAIAARLLTYYDAPEFRKGGTGRQRGGGLAATVAAAAMLTLSLCFVSLAENLPEPPHFAEIQRKFATQARAFYPPNRPMIGGYSPASNWQPQTRRFYAPRNR